MSMLIVLVDDARGLNKPECQLRSKRVLCNSPSKLSRGAIFYLAFISYGILLSGLLPSQPSPTIIIKITRLYDQRRTETLNLESISDPQRTSGNGGCYDDTTSGTGFPALWVQRFACGLIGRGHRIQACRYHLSGSLISLPLVNHRTSILKLTHLHLHLHSYYHPPGPSHRGLSSSHISRDADEGLMLINKITWPLTHHA